MLRIIEKPIVSQVKNACSDCFSELSYPEVIISCCQESEGNILIHQRFNLISNFFSNKQVKAAVESMPNFHHRKLMIDKVLDRREEIRNSEEQFKIQKYAHVFRKLLYKFRQSKQKKAQIIESESKQMDVDIKKCKTQLNLLQQVQQKEESNLTTEEITTSIASQDVVQVLSENQIRFLERIQQKQSQKNDSSPSAHMKERKQSQSSKVLPLLRDESFSAPKQSSLQQEPSKKERIQVLIKRAQAKVDTGIERRNYNQMKTIEEEQDGDKKNRRMALSSMVSMTSELYSPEKFAKKLQIVQNDSDDSDEEQKNDNLRMKLPQLGKYYTIIDPLQIQEQVENEIYGYLMQQKDMSELERLKFLGENKCELTKSIRNMENKIKQRMNKQYINELDCKNKIQYSVQEIIKRDKLVYDKLRRLELVKLKNDLKLKSIQLNSKGQQGGSMSHTLQKAMALQQNAKKLESNESFASYTEIKLNKLYSRSNDIQNDIMKLNKKSDLVMKSERRHNAKLRMKNESQLVQTSREISEVSYKKMNNRITNVIQ